ncbi:response regulator [Amycolatopsis albispora]|uniref:DNA-binding response regulator n=1 Tax=Amycolatopsis albispora TaxID=1804986 RepID=A0A344L1W3_9PSEU|nr:response regulator transcription factor [Amycolatopsis albispora]AXB42037.1 DNA-binding response regulator [Amycolatopsis albispora]
MPVIRVVLVEDHDMVAEAMELVFAGIGDIDLAARAGSMAAAVREVELVNPDLVVLDRRLPDGDGIELIGRLRELPAAPKVLLLTAEVSAAVATRVVEAGGSGVVAKTAGLDQLADAIRRAAAGEMVFDAVLLGEVIDRLSGRAAPAELTTREREILRLFAEGATVEEITQRLHLARNTVRNHAQRALVKLGAHSRLEAVAIARRRGLLD